MRSSDLSSVERAYAKVTEIASAPTRPIGRDRPPLLPSLRVLFLVWILIGLIHPPAGQSRAGAGPSPAVHQPTASLTRGPFLQIGTPTSVVVRWRTDDPANSWVRYGTELGSLTLSASDPTLTTEHEILVDGLSPETRYYYSVGTDAFVLGGDVADHFFITFPSPGTRRPTRVLVLGDPGSWAINAVGVRDAYYAYTGARRTDLWIAAGDLAAGNGSGGEGDDADYQAAIFDMYPELLRASVLFPCRGNHDVIRSGDNNDYYEIFSMPTAGEAGGVASGTEAYYSFDYANIHFVALDSEGSDRSPTGPMLTWLQDDLAANTQDWTIAFFHHPPYSKGTHDSDDPGDSGGRMQDMRENALPIFEAAGVDLVLTGHSHGYERSFMIDGHYLTSSTFDDTMIVNGGDGRIDGDGPYTKPVLGPTPNQGTVYTVAGTASDAQAGGTYDHPVMTTTSALEEGFVVLEVDGDRLDAFFVNDDVAVLDSFTIIKGVEPSPSTIVPFTHVVVDSSPPRHPHVKTVGDIDGDGFTDVLAGGAHGEDGEGLFWYEYPSWTKHTIVPPGTGFTTDMQVGDVDNDGDLDVIVPQGYSKGSSVWWYENPRPGGDPRTAPWIEHSIATAGAHDVEVGDINKDGKLDVVVRENTTTILLQQTPMSWTAVEISTRPKEGTALGDIDGDGDLDVAISSYWLENPMPAGDPAVDPWTEYTVDANWPTDVGVHLADLNKDGQLNVILAPSESSSGRLSWYHAPLGPKAGPWTEEVIDNTVSYLHTFKTADIDRDGNLDIVTAEMQQSDDPDEVSVYFNLGEGLTWTQDVLATTGSHNLRVADVGLDGDFDVVGINWFDRQLLDLWQNELNPHFPLDDWVRHVIDGARPWRSIFVTAEDMDNDGRKDIITGGWWYKNPGTLEDPWARDTLSAPLNNMAAVYDFDRDGDMDVLGTRGIGAQPNDSLVWARNDGQGSFTVLSNIPVGNGDFLQGVAVADFDNDGVPQIALSWHQAGSPVQRLTVPPDPSIDMWVLDDISPTSQNEDLNYGDIDRDGDADLLLGTQWIRNDITSWSSFTLNSTPGEPDRNRLADINRDGRLDAVVGFEAASTLTKLAWYEQGVSPTDTWTEHIIANVIGPMSLDVVDMDFDGDMDVVVGEHNIAEPTTAKLFVFENADDRGNFWIQHEVYTGDEHHDGAQTVDIDNDGDLDIISIGWTHDDVVLYENKAIDNGGTGPTNQPPVAMFTADPTSGPAPLEVSFDASASFDPNGDPIDHTWDFGDGSPPETGELVSHIYDEEGLYTATLTVSDGQENDSTGTTIEVGDSIGPTAGLIHHWKLDESTGTTATDFVGSYDGTLVNGPTWDYDGGRIGGALAFDGVDDYVNLGGVDVAGGTGLTLSLWFKADDFEVYDARFISKATGVQTPDHFWMLSTIDTTALRFRLRTDGTTSKLSTSEGQIETGRWYHIAATYDGTMMRIYKDGVAIDSLAKTGTIDTDPSVVAAIGNQPPGAGSRPFDGLIDDVRIYNRALSASELQSMTRYSLTTNVVGNGQITKAPSQTTYAPGDTVTVTAVPDPGWSFVSWSDGLTGSENPDTIVVMSDTTVTATFDQDT
ncbi:MAG: VCBS repeat-containing protein, partial [Candidatus Latescibacterota bacterium]